MLKHLCGVLLLVTFAFAAPPLPMETDVIDSDDVLMPHSVGVVSTTPIVEILDSGSSHHADGSYHFHFRAEDGSFREETAVMKNPGTKKAYLEVTGAYSYFDADGKEVVVHYKANHRGFVPVGGNIPETISDAAKRNSELPAVVEQRSSMDGVVADEVTETMVMPTGEPVQES